MMPRSYKEIAAEVEAALYARGFSGFTLNSRHSEHGLGVGGIGIEYKMNGEVLRNACVGHDGPTFASEVIACFQRWLVEHGVSPGHR